MAIISDALRQAFMPKHEYESLREEDKAWIKLQRPLLIATTFLLCLVILSCTIVSLNIVFPVDNAKRPFCGYKRLQPLPIMNNDKSSSTSTSTSTSSVDSELYPGAFYLTDQETADFYWMVVFVPTAVFFFLSAVYLVAGIVVAYYAPIRHGCLNVVQNNYCTSKRGGVRCLSILNLVFAVIFGLLALFLGSSLLTLGSSCSVPLFWCYEISSWCLVVLYGGTAFFLKRKAVILDEAEFGNRNFGVEMLVANPVDITPDIERRVNEGFKSWMGSSLLSSDEEEEPDSYQHLTPTLSNRQRS
ncbi:hypothetical protein ACFE04_019195 [Oxalis oulophora]